MVASPPTAVRTKKKKKKTMPPAAHASATDDTLTTTPTLFTAPATNKGKKKSAEPIDLRTLLMWVLTANLTKHCVVAIAHKQR